MTIVPLSYLPGVCKSDSAYANSTKSGGHDGMAAKGRFTGMDKMRFIAGMPEKIGGNAKLSTSLATGIVRGIKDLRDFSQNIYLLTGSAYKLEELLSTTPNTINDITPLRSIKTATLTNPFDTVINSTTVTVHHTAHGLQTGDYVQLVAGSAVGGITPVGIFTNITVTNANTYTIVNSVAASSSVSGGGGTVTYNYYRITLTSPFTTTSGSAMVTVTHTNHGASVGDYVTINGASAVGGITPDGAIQITAQDQNTYTFTWTSNATSSTTGGGTPNFTYNISSGTANNITANGYGVGGYGQGTYGTFSTNSVTFSARLWSIDKYGQQAIVSPINGTIYVWDSTILGRAYPLYNAPTGILASFVTSERYVFALGNSTNPMQVRWPDQNDYTQWTATSANTANTRTLQEGSYLVGGLAVRDGTSLVLSNTACFVFNYSGDNFVYTSTTAGRGCGLIGPLAICVMSNVAYWMSTADFWVWEGTTQNLPSDDIRDYVFKDLDVANSNKCAATPLLAKKEIHFYYPSLTDATGENSRYVIFHTDQNCWSVGTNPVSSYLDRNLFSYPIATNNDASSSYINYMEYGTSFGALGTDNASLTFSPMDISSGERNVDVFSFIPDFQTLTYGSGTGWTITVNTQNYPGDSTLSYGPYTILGDGVSLQDIINLRIGAKLMGYSINETSAGGTMRLGVPRVEAQPSGGRR